MSSPADIGVVSPRNSESGRCLDTNAYTGGGNGNLMQLWDCNGQLQQEWLFVPKGGGSGEPEMYEIESIKFPGMCVDVQRRPIRLPYTYGIANGETVRLWKCNQTVSQLWWIPSNALTEIALVGVGDDGHLKCLDADTGTIGGNGTRMQIWDCLGNANQQWVGL